MAGRARSPPPPLVVNGRILRNSAGWFAEGAHLKSLARTSQRCVECRTRLPDRRSPYCSRKCQWAFRGRYFWDAARTYVMARDRYTCQVCHRRQRARTLEVDHVVEVARGGASLDYLNLQTLCRRCHSAKTRRFLATHRRMAHRPIRLATEVVAAEADGWGASWFPS